LHRPLVDEILAAWRGLVEGAAFVGGQEVAAFEQEFAAYAGTRECVGVGSGTDALRLALLAMEVRPGDEVITAPHTFIATSEAITQAGATPVFVDVDRRTGTLDPERVERAITPRTRVLLPVHLYGQPAAVDVLLEIASRHGLDVLEDAAQAHGAEFRGRRVGSFGRAAAFSFYPGKNLGACGEAGAVTSDDADLMARLRVLRDHGQRQKYHHEVEGYNARLDALQAAALRIKLRHLDAWNQARRHCAATYGRELAGAGVELPEEVPPRRHVWHLYVVRHPRRERIQTHLAERKIGTGLHYPVPLHLQPAYASLGHGVGSFPESERWASQGLSLPMFPGLTEEQIGRVAEAVREAVRGG
jgi:dTDP-4-amino-4,6-dideoxygalactose transaminase